MTLSKLMKTVRKNRPGNASTAIARDYSAVCNLGINNLTRSISSLILTIVLVSCGGGGGGDSGGGTGGSGGLVPPPPVQHASPGGIWIGTDNNGLAVFAIVTEDGRFHWIADTLEQGFGSGTVVGNDFSVAFTYAAPFGFTLEDGSTLADCSGSGTVQERQALSVTVSCTSSGGNSFSSSVVFAYDATYERDSALNTIAGNYDSTISTIAEIHADFGSVLSIDSNGVIFEQDPDTGCVVNGQVSVIHTDFNVYDVTLSYAGCTGELAPLNGSMFTGIAALDNTVDPEGAVVALNGVVQGDTFSIAYLLFRI